MSYSTILVAVDLTEESSQVFEAANQIATNNAATVHVVTVIKPLTQVYGGLDMAPIASGSVSFEEEAVLQATSQLKSLAGTLSEEQVHVVLGAPAQEIRELSEKIGADLIIVGSHGRHGLGLLLGSTANGVLHGVACDVLAVRVQVQ